MLLITGLIAGFILGKIFSRPKTMGDLRIDRSDPASEPYLFLELGTDIYTIINRKYATFRVKIENFLPRE